MTTTVERELIINSEQSDIEIALLEDKVLVELHQDKSNTQHMVGDVYLGRVKRIMTGLNAAFVDVGYEKDAFLHFLDLGSNVNTINKYVRRFISEGSDHISMNEIQYEAEIEKSGKISQIVSTGQHILVQVAKEPISAKGPRISTEISFAGRYLVLVPFSDKVSISQKIKNREERSRLRRLVQSIKPKNYGVIIRTVAENKKVAELDNDLKQLVAKWETAIKRLHNAVPPTKIISEIDRTSAIIRDLLNESFNAIHVDSDTLADETRSYLLNNAPEKAEILKHYKGKLPIFEHFGVSKQIKNSFGKIVTIRSGIYLIIEHTEALHVIDVNSGHRANSANTQEENALEVNMESAKEIARQIRLRDMGGIIVIDFIDLHLGQNRRALYQAMKTFMAKDRAKHTILPPSKFGLVQITRQRVRPEKNVSVLEKCPCCDGTGEVKPSVLLADDIENDLSYLFREQNEDKLTLRVSQVVHSYLTKGIYSIRVKWFFKYGKWIKIVPQNSYTVLQYHFFNKNDDMIKM
ncbi:MAG: Rne/Rng family ribonuclease [Bacteroidales bacterium]|jgi:ribonuclease G|nr:Rne/Rng family ribonuclease [Bacteroidales bacterium]